MRWFVFAIFTYVLLAIELGLGDLMRFGDTKPSVIFVYVVFIAALAPVPVTLWAAFILGLLTDAVTQLPAESATGSWVTMLGPHALGYSLGALLTLQMRTFLDRRHPVTIAIMVLIAGICTHLLAVFAISMRSLLGDWFGIYPDVSWSPTEQLVARFLVILYSSAVALPLGWVLLQMRPLFAFDMEAHYVQRR